MLNLSWRTFFLSNCFLIYSLFILSLTQAHAKTLKDVGGRTMTSKEVDVASMLESQTNLPIFFSGIEYFSHKVKSYNNGSVIADWYSKNTSSGSREAIISVQRVPDAWFGVNSWQPADQRDTFETVMRKKARHINTSTANIVKHTSGGTDFGFSAIDGDCIYAYWGLNLRGVPSWDNDEGAPDTMIELNGCNILNQKPSSVFKKIREMDEQFRSQLMQMISHDSSNKNRSDTATKTKPPKKVQDGTTTLSSGSKEAKLKEAKDLFEKELINENEYEKLKKQILGID